MARGLWDTLLRKAANKSGAEGDRLLIISRPGESLRPSSYWQRSYRNIKTSPEYIDEITNSNELVTEQNTFDIKDVSPECIYLFYPYSEGIVTTRLDQPEREEVESEIGNRPWIGKDAVPMEFNDRQLRELKYHQEHAATYRDVVTKISYEILDNPSRRWWNAYWSIYSLLLSRDLKKKKALVVGCGFGQDALFISKMGADVFAFDLSADMLGVARDFARREGAAVDFRQMAAESLDYSNDLFDLIFVRDILHHCDIRKSMAELARVSKPGAFVAVDEMYTHSLIQRIRESRVVAKWLYPKVVHFIYQGQKPYITEDERKLNEHDVNLLREFVVDARCEYFNVFVNRILPEKDFLCRVDRILVRLLGPVAGVLGGRLLLTGRIRKQTV